MNRTQDYYRHHRKRIIERKKNIVKQCYMDGYFYKVDGKYSKGKIHCSCPMCSVKTKIHGLSRADMRKRDSLNYQEI